MERNLRAEAVERTNQMEQTLRTLKQKCSRLRLQCEERDESLRLTQEQVQRLGEREVGWVGGWTGVRERWRTGELWRKKWKGGVWMGGEL